MIYGWICGFEPIKWPIKRLSHLVSSGIFGTSNQSAPEALFTNKLIMRLKLWVYRPFHKPPHILS